MSLSKRDKKRLKAQQKIVKDVSQILKKPHYEQYQIPPYTQQHMKVLLLQYILYNVFEYPIHHIQIFNKIRSFYQNFQNAEIYMKDLDIPDILKELQKLQCLLTQERAFGTKLVTIIERINKIKIYEEYQKCREDRPIKPPPDLITFQQQKKELPLKQKQNKKILDQLLSQPSLFGQTLNPQSVVDSIATYEDKMEVENFKKSKKYIDYCDSCTRQRCQKQKGNSNCRKKHFRAIINQNTDESYGNCPHLNACHNPDCKLIHYVQQDQQYEIALQKKLYQQRVTKATWINCDLRYFDFKILGKYDVIMADPPWDIHMSLPYGTLKDKVDILQDQGLIFLWVTGRAMELGRQCLTKWGYQRVDQLVWIKTNQINRLIITGKTGHWLNHSKQHCLIGIKGNPKINKKLDCDIIVSKVRQTSRKPDQVYSIIQRMSPGGKKIQLFGRPDNCMPDWLTLGNQLTDIRLSDQDIINRYRQAYPNQDLNESRMQKNLQEMLSQDNLNKIYNNHIQKNTGIL